MRKVLVLFSHPIAHKSRVNVALLEHIKDIEGVTVHDLYDTYPDFYIDVQYEQELLLSHDVIIWQHPFYWYSAPAILKEWMDLVLEHGFAYGRGANALKGKHVISVLTTGGKAETYQKGGLNRFPVTDFLLPFDQTCHLCQMTYHPPFIVHGTHLLSSSELTSISGDYLKMFGLLTDPEFDLQQLNAHITINDFLNA